MRETWAGIRDELEEAFEGTKDAQGVTLELAKRYRALSSSERQTVDQILAEWALSSDEVLRFDALSLIDEFRIESALPSLRRLAKILEEADNPGAPYEWAKVNRIIGRLAAG